MQDMTSHCPLSAAQQEVLLAIEQEGRNLNYHLCDVVDFQGELQPTLLLQAIKLIGGQMETLRTVFCAAADSAQSLQYVHPQLPASYCQWHDLSSASNPEQACQALLDTLLKQDMDLSQGPLAHYSLVKLAERHYRLIELGSHLVVDGFGHAILFNLISDCYAKLHRGEAVLPQPAEPLAQVFAAEQAYRQSESYAKDQAYWRQYCLNMPEATQLVPGNAPLVKLNRLRKIFAGPALERLRDAATQYQLRLSSLLLALCATYLYKMTGQEELAVGMPVAARQIKALRSMPSMVANILPLHLSFSAESTVLSVATAIQRQLRRHLLHQSYRSESMIRDLFAERGHKPLFNTLLNIVAYEQHAQFEGCQALVQNVANGPAAHLGIDLFDRNPDGRLEIGFNANADLYAPEALELHYQRLLLLLERFAAAPKTLAADYDLLLPAEAAHFYPQPATADKLPLFVDAFAACALTHAERPALRQDGRELSYAQLDEYAERLASRLMARGVSAGDNVALFTARSIEWVVAAVALFKLGACYVPIDPDLPPARIAYILADADPRLLILSADQPIPTEIKPEKQLRLVPGMLDTLPSASTLPGFDPATPAYMIYTSGSTGQPKGVEVTHRNLVPIARSAIEAAALQPGQRVLQFIAAGFDLSVLEIMMTLLAGATLTLADKIATTPGKPLAKLIKRENISVLVMTPSLLAYHQTEDFPQHTVLLLGGEPCAPALLARFAHCRLLNVYGPTETSFATSINAHYGAGDLSIGPATANTRLYVVDKQQRLLPPGAWGELFIGGPGVAKGYRNRPELTATGFVADLLEPACTMYRVGDRVFFDHLGRIHYQGRQDGQVKLRGLRIELDEIKNALLGCAGVEDAVALLQTHTHGPAIVAYVANPQLTLDSERLKQALNRQLPHHMIPSIIMVLPSFPLSANGKLAIKQLPAPTLCDDSERLLARTPQEELICRLFSSVLECGEVYAKQNFFALGGHSLLGLQLINLINDTLGVTLSIADFLAAPTPHQLAQRLEQASQQHSDPFGALLPLRTQGTRPPLFCIHPGGGIAWPYAGLLPFLPDDQPLYAIQSPILRDPDRLILSLDELAEEYRQHIQRIQPQGPYQLAGWSVGGNLALRLATLLQKQGHDVSFLCMFDSYPLQGGPASLKLDDATIIARMTRAIVGAPRAGLNGLKSALDQVLGRRHVGEDLLIRLVNDAKQMLTLLAQCQYDRFDGDLIFIRALSDILRPEDQQPSLWQPYVSGTLIEYPADAPHECLLQRQYLEQFAPQLVSELLKRQQHDAATRRPVTHLEVSDA